MIPEATVTLTTTTKKNEQLAKTVKKLHKDGKIDAKNKCQFLREAVNEKLATLGSPLKM
jgi:hypothetical protein